MFHNKNGYYGGDRSRPSFACGSRGRGDAKYKNCFNGLAAMPEIMTDYHPSQSNKYRWSPRGGRGGRGRGAALSQQLNYNGRNSDHRSSYSDKYESTRSPRWSPYHNPWSTSQQSPDKKETENVKKKPTCSDNKQYSDNGKSSDVGRRFPAFSCNNASPSESPTLAVVPGNVRSNGPDKDRKYTEKGQQAKHADKDRRDTPSTQQSKQKDNCVAKTASQEMRDIHLDESITAAINHAEESPRAADNIIAEMVDLPLEVKRIMDVFERDSTSKAAASSTFNQPVESLISNGKKNANKRENVKKCLTINGNQGASTSNKGENNSSVINSNVERRNLEIDIDLVSLKSYILSDTERLQEVAKEEVKVEKEIRILKEKLKKLEDKINEFGAAKDALLHGIHDKQDKIIELEREKADLLSTYRIQYTDLLQEAKSSVVAKRSDITAENTNVQKAQKKVCKKQNRKEIDVPQGEDKNQGQEDQSCDEHGDEIEFKPDINLIHSVFHFDLVGAEDKEKAKKKKKDIPLY